MESKTNALTNSLEYAVECIEGHLQAMRHEMFTQRPWDAAITLQLLAEGATRHAVTARAHQAQLTALMRMQEAANAEQKEED